MNLTVAALLGLTMSQPPAADYFPYKERTLKLPISYPKEQERRNIRQVRLFVSDDQGSTWKQEAAAPPTQESFAFTAKQDGPYWFHIVIVDLQGRSDPPNLTVVPPDMKVLIDTVPPQVKFRTAKRKGEEVVVEWAVEDKYPDETATKVYYRAATAPETAWAEVSIHPSSRNGVQFPVATSGAVVVKVVARDLVGNESVGLREIPVVEPIAATSTSASVPANPTPPPTMGAAPAVPPPSSLVPTETPVPAGPAAPPPSAAPPIVTPPTSPVVPAPPSVAPAAAPLAVGSGLAPAAATPMFTAASGQTVLAVGTGTSAVAPSVEMSRATVVNYLRFDLGYEVEQRGPSGISRVDLWLTRDDGRTWTRWSQHDGRESPIRVILDARGNVGREHIEGMYGFRVVPVSGAGLSDGAPASGDAPDMRVVVDVTPPVVKIFEPGSDPVQRDTLEIRWEATDKNFGDDPITLEWGENPNGPWRPVLTGGPDGVVQATAIAGLTPRRLANTGRYSWRVPSGLPAKVYLKVSARDAAENVSEVVTPQPILVDLMKPRAKITGIGSSLSLPRP